MKLRWLEPLLLMLIPNVAAGYSCWMGHTTRVRIITPSGEQSKKDMLNWKQGAIYCCWHSRFFYFSYFGRGQRVATMISASKDGEFITRTIAKLRLYAIRGSSSKFGHEAMEEAVAALCKKNMKILMIPDGPRGPRYKAKPGVIRLAQLSGRPIVPVSFSSTSGIFLPTWDRFFIPMPYGDAVITIDNPIYVPAEITSEEFEQYRVKFENSMNHTLAQADQFCGRDPEKETAHWKKRKP